MIPGANLNSAMRANAWRTPATSSQPAGAAAENRQQPRFGWRKDTHRVIDVGSERLLPGASEAEKSLKRFLTWNRSEIKLYNDLQDYCSPQNNHFLDLELVDPEVGIFNVDEKTWQRVKDAFRPERLQQLERHWQVDPLSPNKVHAGESLLYAITATYVDLVKRFRLIREGMPNMYKEDNKRLDQAHQRVFYHELIRRIGELGHFVGDMMMPLHATGLFDYPLAGPSEKRIHRFIEVEVMNPRTNRSILEQSRKIPHRPLDTVNSDTLQPYVMGYIQNSYKKIFELVAAQRKVMEDNRLNKDPKYYEAALKRKFLPILKPQVLEAQRVLASLVHSAWVEAGQPTLKHYKIRTDLRKPS